jgi:mono/diheme cytochrome c family protein
VDAPDDVLVSSISSSERGAYPHDIRVPSIGNPRITRQIALLGFALLAAGCNEPGTLGKMELGRTVYERTVGGLACADCHGESAGPRANPDWLAPGHPLGGVLLRESLWGGRFEGDQALVDASLYCAARFQYRMLEEVFGEDRGPDFSSVPLTREEREGLFVYLATFPGGDEPVSTRRDDDIEAVFDLGGDPDDGELVWAAACAVCHGSEAEGGLGPPLTGDDAVDPFTLADYVRQGSAFDSPDTWMPHFRADRLSAQQLADLMARWAE